MVVCIEKKPVAKISSKNIIKSYDLVGTHRVKFKLVEM